MVLSVRNESYISGEELLITVSKNFRIIPSPQCFVSK